MQKAAASLYGEPGDGKRLRESGAGLRGFAHHGGGPRGGGTDHRCLPWTGAESGHAQPEKNTGAAALRQGGKAAEEACGL